MRGGRQSVNDSTQSIFRESDNNLLGVGVEKQRDDLTSAEGMFNAL